MKINPRFFSISLFLLTFFAFQPLTHAQQVSAWLPSWEVEQAFDSFKENKDLIDTVSPFWYGLNEDGTLFLKKDAEDQTIIDFAKENSIPIVPTIANSFDGQKVSDLLNDPQKRADHIQSIVNKVLELDYDGIDIDYEGLFKEDIDLFSAFVKELHEALSQHGKKLTLAVMSQSYEMLPKFGNRGQDWAELGKYVDEFRIMTYDYGWSGSIPRPTAPHYWVEEVIKYAVDQVPAEKIRLGVPFYGYAWSNNGVEGGKEFYSYTHEGILEILKNYGVDLQYSPKEKTNRLFYLSQYDDRTPKAPFEIWFENRVSLEPKLDLVKKYNLGGIAVWRLGREDVDNWRLIGEKLKDQPKTDPLYFSDVNVQTPYAQSINRLAFLGLVKGQGETGQFDPLSKVNRAEILKMSLNSFAVDTSKYTFPETRPETFVNPFPDLADDAWYSSYIQTAVDEGIAKGYPDGTFKPGNNIIRVEAIKLALESAGVDLKGYDQAEWYFPYRDWALEHQLYSPDSFVADEEITRAEAAYIVAKVIEVVEGQ